MAHSRRGSSQRQSGSIEVKTIRQCLSPSEIEAYDRDGVVFPVAVLWPTRTAVFRLAFETLEAGLGGRPAPARWTNLCFPWAYDLTMESSVLDSVEALLGPDIIVSGSIILYKHPYHNGYVAWHQDSIFSGADGVASVSAWIALTDSTPANGCMRVIPGTHRELLAHRDVLDPTNLLRPGRMLAAAVDEDRAVDVVLRAGEMSLHHDRVIHGSRPNCGGDKRVGFVVRYTTPAARTRGFPVVRARGKLDCSHLTLGERPPESEPREALAAYHQFSAAMERVHQQRNAR
jgi:non-heme Fe2+,alpha-ketoglutarate-dependent halogenase